jgi:hypothetical protein
MAEEIEIIVTATGFDKVSTGLKNTSEALKSTATEAKKTGDALKSNLNAGSAQAGQSLQNLSRIAQDAPFGFIGIANNINPLVESFGRLKAESGSTGGALKALVGGLSGPAGLGLAFGVVTAAISFAQLGFAAWTGTSKKAKEQVDELKKSQEEFAKSLDTARAGALSNGLALQSYVNIAKNGQLPLEQRNEALNKANEILGKHGELLTLTNVATAAVTREVQLYTNALVAQAVAQKYVDDLAKNFVERTRLQKELTKATNDSNAAQLENARAIKVADEAARAGAIIGTLTQESARKYADALERLKIIQIQLAAVNNNITNSQIELNKSTLDATAAFGALGTKQKDIPAKVEKSKKALETFNDVILKTVKNIADQKELSIVLDESTIKEQIKIVRDAIERGVKDFNQPGNDQRILTLKALLTDLEAQKAVDDAGDKIQKKAKQQKGKLTITVPVIVNPDINIGKELEAAIAAGISKIGIGLGEGIAAAIQGTTNFGQIFQGIFGELGGVVKQLGEQIIQLGALALAAQLAIGNIFANPLAAVAAGIALVALGSLIQSTTARQNRFAVGTRNAPGGMALVGERGPELVNLPRGSQVIPAAQTSNMMGGVAGGLEIYGILRGQDIFFSNKKYSATYARTT